MQERCSIASFCRRAFSSPLSSTAVVVKALQHLLLPSKLLVSTLSVPLVLLWNVYRVCLLRRPVLLARRDHCDDCSELSKYAFGHVHTRRCWLCFKICSFVLAMQTHMLR